MSGLSQEIARNRSKGGVDAPVAEPEAEATETEMPSADIEGAAGEDPMALRRRNRKPFGSHSQKLAYPPRQGYHRHWFNDVPGRVERAKEAGYEHVLGDDKKSVKRPVGVKEGGGVLLAYLMEIPQQWYDDDMKAQQDLIDKQERALERGKPLETEGESQSNFYNTAQGRVTRFNRTR